jgi:hypothetical protein
MSLARPFRLLLLFPIIEGLNGPMLQRYSSRRRAREDKKPGPRLCAETPAFYMAFPWRCDPLGGEALLVFDGLPDLVLDPADGIADLAFCLVGLPFGL